MKRIALVGGTGSATLLPATAEEVRLPATPWGEASGTLRRWRCGATEVCYLPRHGWQADIAPHRVNYRANVHALRALAPDAVLGLNAVGGIAAAAAPGRVVLPDQLIDYSWGRGHTFYDGGGAGLEHVEFDPPFTGALRERIRSAAAAAGVAIVAGGTYGVTQGPRLETAAEIRRLAADGCDIVGMTAMPEAALAREAGLDYAICAVVVNHAAGRLPAGASIHGQMRDFLARGMADLAAILDAFLRGA